MSDKHDCIVYLTVVMKDGEFTVSRSFTLPFLPFVGMQLVFGNEDEVEVNRVQYVVDGDIFWLDSLDCAEEETCPCEPNDKCCVMDTSYHIEHGWELYSKTSLADHPFFRRNAWQFTEDQLKRLVDN